MGVRDVQVIASPDKQEEMQKKAIERQFISYTYTETPLPWSRQPIQDYGSIPPEF